MKKLTILILSLGMISSILLTTCSEEAPESGLSKLNGATAQGYIR